MLLKVEWRYVIVKYGEQYAVIVGDYQMPELYADSCKMVLQVCIIHLGEGGPFLTATKCLGISS